MRCFIRGQGTIDRHIQPELHLDRALAGIDGVLAELDPADPAGRNAQLVCGGLPTAGIVLGFLQGKNDIDGFKTGFHGTTGFQRMLRLRPASSTLTKVTRVEKIIAGPAFSSITFTE